MNPVLLATVVIMVTISGHIPLVDTFSTGAPADSCKDPSAFHTRKINATHEGIILPKPKSTNPYRLVVESTSFTPGEEISVSMIPTYPVTELEGFFIAAVQANIDIRDLRREAFGVFRNTTTREQPSPCQSRLPANVGGITHTDARPKRNVTVVWVAPIEYDLGNVQFLATGVQKYDVYWTDIRSGVLESKGYQGVTDPVEQKSLFSSTALWYLWLQQLRQQLSHSNHTDHMTPKTTPKTRLP